MMSYFIGLDGVKAGKIDGHFSRTVTQMLDALKSRRATCKAGDKGVVTAWKDDAGCYRSIFERLKITEASAKHKSKAALEEWLKEWAPKCDRGQPMTTIPDLAALLREAVAEIEKLNRLLNYKRVAEKHNADGSITVTSVERTTTIAKLQMRERYEQECGGTIDALGTTAARKPPNWGDEGTGQI